MRGKALIGLGSNLGDRRAALDDALASLDSAPGLDLIAVSPYLEMPPIGGPDGQGAFLNASALLETDLEPANLLHILQGVETRAGRVRSARWGERTLDLDLLLHGDRILDEPALRVPHPRIAVRRFVLMPAVAIAPGMVEPVTGRSLADLLANLDRRPGVVAFRGPWSDVLARLLVDALPSAVLVEPKQGDSTAADAGADRWLVVPFWNEGALGPRPTFLGATDPDAYTQARNPGPDAFRCDIPVIPIWPDGPGPARIDSPPTPATLAAMLTEALAACQGCRAECLPDRSGCNPPAIS